MNQRKLKRRSNLFHSTKNGLQKIIVLKNLAQEKFATCTTCANNFGVEYGGEDGITWNLHIPISEKL